MIDCKWCCGYARTIIRINSVVCRNKSRSRSSTKVSRNREDVIQIEVLILTVFHRSMDEFSRLL